MEAVGSAVAQEPGGGATDGGGAPMLAPRATPTAAVFIVPLFFDMETRCLSYEKVA